MKWSEICIHTTNEAQEPITNILQETGITGVIIEDPLDLTKERETFFGEIYDLDPSKYPIDGIYLKFYLPAEDSTQTKIEKIKKEVNHLSSFDIDLGANIITINEVYEEDWATAWKKYYKPVKISEKITIAPTWEKVDVASNDEILIELDPGMAFGTGTHPTTMQSVQALEKYIQQNDTIIDVGCGSGVLSIAACLLGASKSYAYDIDPVAVNSTKLNVQINNLTNKIDARENNLLKNINMQVDLIVANILAEIIVLFVKDAYNNLKENGIFITSGIIQKKKQVVIDELQAVGFQILDVNEDKGWVCIIAKK